MKDPNMQNEYSEHRNFWYRGVYVELAKHGKMCHSDAPILNYYLHLTDFNSNLDFTESIYNLTDLVNSVGEFHSGTSYEVMSITYQPHFPASKTFKVGCDYNHLWDNELYGGYGSNDGPDWRKGEMDACNSVDKLIEAGIVKIKD